MGTDGTISPDACRQSICWCLAINETETQDALLHWKRRNQEIIDLQYTVEF